MTKKPMKPPLGFWLAWVMHGKVCDVFAVSARTERGARMAVRRARPAGTIKDVVAVGYAHAWFVEMGK